MYNPSRGGVRGGADQFTWESVKTDKHRENYLGHSLMAPVGRWQKGKDLSWYAKERRDDKTQELIDKSEMASIKKAEEEAMLIALGHNIVRKTQTLTKEDMREALKRNTERDDHHIERIDGVGAASQRIAALSGVRKDTRQNNEGVAFETVRDKNVSEANDNNKASESISDERKKHKKSKKHKKEKKHKRHHKESHDSDLSEDSSKNKTKYQKNDSGEYNDSVSSKVKHSKKSKHRYEDYSDSSHSNNEKSSQLKKCKSFKTKTRIGSDSPDNNEKRSSNVKSHQKFKIAHQDHSSDSYSSADIDEYRTKNKKRYSDYDEKKSLKEKSHKKSKHKHRDHSPADSYKKSHSDSEKREHKRHKEQKECVKRRRHDSSESD